MSRKDSGLKIKIYLVSRRKKVVSMLTIQKLKGPGRLYQKAGQSDNITADEIILLASEKSAFQNICWNPWQI